MTTISRVSTTRWVSITGKEFWLLQLLGWGSYGAIIIFSSLTVTYDHDHPSVLFGLITMFQGLLLSGFLAGCYGFLHHRPPAMSILISLCLILIAAFSFAVGDYYAISFLESEEVCAASLWGRILRCLPGKIYILSAWSGLYFGAFFYAEARAEREVALQATAAADHAELEMLRYQLQPHLLFNALNTISGLIIRGDKKDAEQMVQNISAFLRHMLQTDSKGPVPLAKEIGFVERYLGIEKTRFADRLSVEIDIADAVAQAAVPAFILQPLVENAIKYGLNAQAGKVGLVLKAWQEREQVQISFRTIMESKRNKTALFVSSTGMGEQNVRERLELHYGIAATFYAGRQENGDYLVSLSLPLVPYKQENITP